MKKILSIALVALLAGSAFAAFTGSATLGLGYNFEKDTYGFSNSNKFDLDFELATDSAEKVAEGDVYASIKANFAVVLVDGDDKTSGFSDGMPLTGGSTTPGGIIKDKDGKDQTFVKDVTFTNNLFAVIKLSEAKVAGENWYVSIKGTSSNVDLAKSAIDTRTIKNDTDDFGFGLDDYDEAVTYKAAYDKAPGFEAGYADYVIGAGFKGVKNKEFGYNVFVATPEYDFDVVTLKLAASASDKYSDKPEDYKIANVGVSAKVGFATDAFSGFVASDLGFEKLGTENWKAEDNFKADVAANFAISPVTVDAYYATYVKTAENKETKKVDYTKDLLSVQAKVDLNDFDVPVALTVAGKDLVNTQDISLKAEFAVTEQVSLDAKVGYVIGEKKLYTEGNVKYAADAFTLKAGMKYSTVIETEKSNILSATASIESSVLIPGATLKLEYAKGDKTMNFLKDQTASEAPQNFGKINASCKIAF